MDLSTTGFSSRLCKDLGWAIARNRQITHINLESCVVDASGLSNFTLAIHDDPNAKEKREEAVKMLPKYSQAYLIT